MRLYCTPVARVPERFDFRLLDLLKMCSCLSQDALTGNANVLITIEVHI